MPRPKTKRASSEDRRVEPAQKRRIARDLFGATVAVHNASRRVSSTLESPAPGGRVSSAPARSESVTPVRCVSPCHSETKCRRVDLSDVLSSLSDEAVASLLFDEGKVPLQVRVVCKSLKRITHAAEELFGDFENRLNLDYLSDALEDLGTALEHPEIVESSMMAHLMATADRENRLADQHTSDEDSTHTSREDDEVASITSSPVSRAVLRRINTPVEDKPRSIVITLDLALYESIQKKAGPMDMVSAALYANESLEEEDEQPHMEVTPTSNVPRPPAIRRIF